MSIVLGKCPVCGDDFMTPTGQPLPNHQQIMIKLSNGDTTYVAFCRKHEVTNELLEDITNQTLEYLANQAPNEQSKKRYQSLTYDGIAS